MNTPMTITALLLSATLFSSCVKNKFTCDCYKGTDGNTEHREYTIRASTASNARLDCKNYELKLVEDNDVYSCVLR